MPTTVQEQLKQQYPQAEQSLTTTSDEEYLLTPEDEARLVAQEVKSLKEHYFFRMTNREVGQGMFAEAARKKISETTQEEWEARVDKPALFRRSNSNLLQERWHLQQREREAREKQQKETERKAFWTAKQFYRFMAWNHHQLQNCREELKRPLIANDDTMPLIKALCFFLSRDERFETDLGYSLNKGLWIRGVSGLGKTHLVNCVMENELNPIKVLPVLEVMEGVRQNGEFNIGTDRIIYLDDVGTETSPIKYFGTEINWVKDFIEMSYTGSRPFNRLMFSSNLPFEEIEAKYGYRVRSRLKEMVNVVKVSGQDLRG